MHVGIQVHSKGSAMAIVRVSLGSAETFVNFRVFFPEMISLSVSDVNLGEIIPGQNSTETGYRRSMCGKMYQKVNHFQSIAVMY